MLVLSVDTSTRGCSVAVHENGVLLASHELYTDKSSSAMLTTLMKNVVGNIGFSLSEVDAIAVGKGPGSYTGLRVGVATAKGLCYALDKPLIAVNTLEAMAKQVTPFFPEETLFCPMIDARRMEVYSTIVRANGEIVLPTQATIMAEGAFAEILEANQVVFFGDGAAKCRNLLAGSDQAVFLKTEIRPSARTVGDLATERYHQDLFEDIRTFEPYYLKDFMTPPSRKVPSPTV